MLAIAVCLTPAMGHGQDGNWWSAIEKRPGAMVKTGLPSTAWSVMPAAASEPYPAPESAPAEGTLPLETAIRRGLTINPAVRAAIAEAESAGTEVDIAEWGYFPEVDLSAGPEEFPFDDLGYDVSARQMLYDWGRVDSQVERANAAQREAKRELGVAEEEAALDIAEVYLDVLAARRRYKVTRRYIGDLEKLRTLTRDRGSNGYTDRSEQGRVALDLAQARDDLASEQGRLDDARHQFRVLVGIGPANLVPPEPILLTERLATDSALDDWIVSAPAYRKAVASAEQAQAQLDEANAALKPQLNLEGTLQRRQVGGELENDSVIGLRLRMDTLQGLANFQRPKSARQRLEAARYRIDDQRREIRRNILTLIENATVYRDRQRALREQIEQAESVGELYDDQFSVGLRDINDLLTIRQEAYSARRQLIDLESQQKRIQYRAASQLGLMNPLLTGRLGGNTP